MTFYENSDQCKRYFLDYLMAEFQCSTKLKKQVLTVFPILHTFIPVYSYIKFSEYCYYNTSFTFFIKINKLIRKRNVFEMRNGTYVTFSRDVLRSFPILCMQSHCGLDTGAPTLSANICASSKSHWNTNTGPEKVLKVKNTEYELLIWDYL